MRFALRASRGGVIAATAVAAFNALAQAVGYAQFVTSDAERQAFAQQMVLFGQQVAYLIPPPVELDTAAGYVQWRAFGSLAMVYAFWAALASTGAARGDEERGVVEQFLAAGASRARYLATRIGAFAALAAVSALVAVAAAGVGIALAKESVAATALLEQAIALWTLTLACYGLGLVAAQLAGTRRSAGGVAGIALLALFLVNSAARTGAGLAELRGFSPFYHYELSQPLTRTGSLDAGATIALLAMAAILTAVAALAFQRRDLGSGLIAPRPTGVPVRAPSRDPFLRLPVLALVDQQRLGIVAWTIATVLLGLFIISISRALVELMTATPLFRLYLERAGIAGYATFMGTVWFGLLLFLVTLYAITQVAGWIADESDGRLETQLAAPVSRGRVVVERAAALLVGAAVIAAAAALVTVAGTAREETPLATGDVARAAILLLPVVLMFGAVGHALIGWRPGLAVPALGTIAIASFFLDQLGPLYDLPEWARNLSVFALYGTPLTQDVDVTRLAALLTVAGMGLAVGIASFRRRDVAA